jgi:hypothetical protein
MRRRSPEVLPSSYNETISHIETYILQYLTDPSFYTATAHTCHQTQFPDQHVDVKIRGKGRIIYWQPEDFQCPGGLVYYLLITASSLSQSYNLADVQKKQVLAATIQSGISAQTERHSIPLSKVSILVGVFS